MAATATTDQTAKPSLTDGKSSLLTSTAVAPADETTDATKGDDESKTEDKAKPDAKPTAPEAYTDFKLPDGFTLEAPTLEKAKALFKDLGLPQEGAQKLVDFHADQLKAAGEAPFKLWQDTQEAWLDEIRSDPKIGKLVDNGTVGASVSKMISTLPTEQATAFREALNFTGSGNNPAIVRGLFELSKKFAEPGHVQGNAPADQKTRPSIAQAMYPPQSKA